MALLKTDVFRQRVKEFIEANIKADVSSANTRQLVASRRERAVSYSRPVDPRKDHYVYAKGEAEKRLV